VPDSRFHFWIKRDLKDFSIVSEKSSQARLNKHSLLFWCFSVWVGSQNLSKNLLALLERTKWNLLLWIIKYGNGVKTHWLWKLHYNGEWNCGCRSSESKIGMSQVAIQFHQHFTYYFLNLFFYVSRKSCRNATLYEKFVRLTLMKLTSDQHQNPQEILNPFSRRQSSYLRYRIQRNRVLSEKGAELVC